MLARELKISEPPLLRHGAKMNRKNVTWKGVSDHAGIIIERPVLAAQRPIDSWSKFSRKLPFGGPHDRIAGAQQSARQQSGLSYLRLLCHLQRIIDLNAKVTHGRLQFAVPE
jgi:hypothetical protein